MRAPGIRSHEATDFRVFSLDLHYLCFKEIEGRLRLGIKNIQAYFVLLSTCTTFVPFKTILYVYSNK